ncbi:MAG: CRISPR-associated endonuclease Cas2 [Oscillospiraceae bacterium]
MLVLITYDVNTETAAGKTRLRKVAKICVDYGQRVQNSVFECALSPAQLCVVKDKLLKVIHPATDSLRFYNLGNQYKSRIEHYGAKDTYLPDDPLVF